MSSRAIFICRTMLFAVAALLSTAVLREGVIQNASRVPSIFSAAVSLSIGAPAIDELEAEIWLKHARQSAANVNGEASLRLLESESLQKAESEARSALRADIARVDSLAVVGLALNARGERAEALDVFSAASALSRRNLLTRIFFMEHYGRQGQVAPMFREIDLALRTSASAQDLMFPILANALAAPEIIPQVSALLNAEPEWASSFVYHAITNSTSATNIAEAYLSSNTPYYHSGVDLTQLLIETLIVQRHFGTAFRVKDKFGQGVSDRGLVTNADFTNSREKVPFNWELRSSADFEAARSRDERGQGALSVQIFGPTNETVTRQLLRLEPGRYIFSNGLSERSGSGDEISAQWRLRCAVDDSEIGQFEVRQDTVAEWSVPKTCPFQWLELYIAASKADSSKAELFTPVALKRVGD